jgi:hypothetical protein
MADGEEFSLVKICWVVGLWDCHQDLVLLFLIQVYYLDFCLEIGPFASLYGLEEVGYPIAFVSWVLGV